MIFSWSTTSLADFASFQQLMGIKVRCVNGTYWTEVRPGFYRPLLLWEPLSPGSFDVPLPARLGGFQYALVPGHSGNSHLNWFIYDQPRSYTVADLAKNPRRQLRIGLANFVIREVTDSQQFAAEAWPVYQSFHQRTRYRTGSHRREHRVFAAWANGLFQIPGLLILGGYREDRLGGVSLSLRIKDTIYYASVFCDDESLRLSLYDVFWHTLRESAAAATNVKQMFMGMYVYNPGLDKFKALRGAKLVRQPAQLEINPLARAVVRTAWPSNYRRLIGEIAPEDLEKHSPAVAVSPSSTSHVTE